jgi:hypothetical protein
MQGHGVLTLSVPSQRVKPQMAESGHGLEGLTRLQELNPPGVGSCDGVTPGPLGRRLLLVTFPQPGGTKCDLHASPVAVDSRIHPQDECYQARPARVKGGSESPAISEFPVPMRQGWHWRGLGRWILMIREGETIPKTGNRGRHMVIAAWVSTWSVREEPTASERGGGDRQ